MTDDRYKQIMADLGQPNSRSLLQALQQVANEVAQEQQATLRATLDEAPTVALTDSATVELAWLEGWLQFANEWVGGECCGHGVRGECCGNPDPVTRRPAEVIEAMARRHRVLTAMLGEKGKKGGA